MNEHVFRVAIDPRKAHSRYVFHFLSSPPGQSQILSDFRGATVGGIGRTFVDRVEVPLPALDEQRCIAAILDQTEHLRETRRETLSLLDRLAQAVFVEMFGDPVTNSVGWPRRPIEQIGSVTTSNNPPRANIDSTVPT